MSCDHTAAWIHEIFASIQGEGIYCGQSHTFVRFAGCNLACAYCDTPQSRKPRPALCRISDATAPNPVSVRDVAAECNRLGRRTVALTGGEPLLQAHFLANLMPALRDAGLLNYLETNGTLYKHLARVAKYADCIAMDIKLPSATGQDAQWEAHARFLEIALGTEVFVKAVVTNSASEDEVRRCATIVAGVDRRTPLVLQPAAGDSPTGERLVELQSIALELLDDVRVIQQYHKVLGLP